MWSIPSTTQRAAMNKTYLTSEATSARPLGRRPQHDPMSFAGSVLMLAGAAAVAFALLAGLSQVALA